MDDIGDDYLLPVDDVLGIPRRPIGLAVPVGPVRRLNALVPELVLRSRRVDEVEFVTEDAACPMGLRNVTVDAEAGFEGKPFENRSTAGDRQG